MSLFVAKRLGLIAVVVIAAGACSPQSSVAAAQSQGQDSQPAPVAIPAQAPSSPQPVGTLNGRVLPDFATLVEQVGPAVVNVSVMEKPQRVSRRQESGDESDDPVQEFFRRFGMPQNPQGRGYEQQPRVG